MIKALTLAAALALTAVPAAAQGKLTPAEARVVAAAGREQARSEALLEKLVNVNSGTMNLAGVEEVGRMMRAELEPLGFQVQWIPKPQTGRAGHLVATHKGAGRGKRMLLIGHLDTVFEPDSPFQKYVKKSPTVAEGPGAGDMKGGLVVMLAALRAMQAAGTLKDADITIVLTGDEERPGRPLDAARAELLKAADQSDVALEFEGLAQEGGKDMGSIARRSSGQWTVEVTARSGHSSGVFSQGAGDGAIYELARILDAFREELREPNATFNPGLVLGGATAEVNALATGGTATGKTNIIAAKAIAHGDLRTLSNAQTERIREKMRAIVARPLNGAEAKISFQDGYPAMPPTEGSRALLNELNAVNRDLGLPQMAELDPLKRGAGDIAFVAGKVDGLIGLGPGGSGSHAPGETVDLSTFERQTKRAALLMTRLSQSR
ncbi:MAG TPA: M20/M25/M40 family metallo-hydrolase [Phenylobacterium sp.]|nr:M20/M25/M40 family metallo-hydrolase [Phenylobacterium sp.]